MDGPIDVLDGVFSREEEGFELAAGHIDPALDQAPEVLGKEFSIGAVGTGPVDDRVRVKEKRHHAPDALHLGIDTVIASGRKESIAETFAECFKVLIGWIAGQEFEGFGTGGCCQGVAR